MARKITENKERRRAQMRAVEDQVKEAQRTPQPSPRLSPSMMTGPNALTKTQQATAKKLFRRIDVDKSMSLDEREILVLFNAKRAQEIKQALDSDMDNNIGLDEWNRYLRTYKREAYTEAITNDPNDEEGALEIANEALNALFEEMAEGLESDDAKRLRSIIKQRDIEMNADKGLEANPLGGMKLKPSPAVKAARAEQVRNKQNVIKARCTPVREKVYHPGAQREYSARGTNHYGSNGNWKLAATRNIADAMELDTYATALQVKSSSDRTSFRAAAHSVYNETTNMLHERAKDSLNANKKIEKALQGTEGYVRSLEEARAAVAHMFELDAEALEEVSFCKEKRASRPQAERIKDQVSLSLKRRTEELDIESHEEMLAIIDKTQKSLWKARDHLNAHLGSKVVAADIDMEAADMVPDLDPAERVEKEEIDPNVDGDLNVWVKPKKLPTSRQGLFASFSKYARAYPLRGTGLPLYPTFAEIQDNNSYIDQTEFAKFIADYGFGQMLDQTQIAEVFQHNARGEDGQAGSLHFEEFVTTVKEIKALHKQEKMDWGNNTPEPTPFQPARKTALTMEEVVFEGRIKTQIPPGVSLHDKVYIPVHQPVMWKKEVRDLCDSVKGQEAEANRICKKSKAFIEKRKYEDEQGRKHILSALHKKRNGTMDLVSKLQKQKEIAYQDYERDITEQEEVESRIAAVEDYLSIAVCRLQTRQKRPASERGRDPAEWALDEEVRELRWELHGLGTTHKRLVESIAKLGKTILTLDTDMNDKTTAMNLDQECVEKVMARQLEAGEQAGAGLFAEGESSSEEETGYN